MSKISGLYTVSTPSLGLLAPRPFCTSPADSSGCTACGGKNVKKKAGLCLMLGRGADAA